MLSLKAKNIIMSIVMTTSQRRQIWFMKHGQMKSLLYISLFANRKSSFVFKKKLKQQNKLIFLKSYYQTAQTSHDFNIFSSFNEKDPNCGCATEIRNGIAKLLSIA